MLIDSIKKMVRKTFIYNLIEYYRQHKDLVRWVKNGRVGPTPHLIKQAIIKEYAKEFNISILVETGTFMGDMVSAMKQEFVTIISIELSNNLYKRAMKRFSSISHIQIVRGDSAKVLPNILTSITEPALFWLDAHYSAGFTEKGDSETPIKRELDCILKHPISNHVILIDDARCFTGQNDYPSLVELKKIVETNRPHFDIQVKEDIIRIHPRNNSDIKIM
jgi:hypothetical protein